MSRLCRYCGTEIVQNPNYEEWRAVEAQPIAAHGPYWWLCAKNPVPGGIDQYEGHAPEPELVTYIRSVNSETA